LRDVVGDHAGRLHRRLAELGIAGNLPLHALSLGVQQVAQAAVANGRKIAFVGAPDRDVAESLREHGYRLEGVRGDSIIGLARELHRIRPALLHARAFHIKAAIVGRLFDLPIIVQVSRNDLGGLTARAARMSSRALCGGAAVRESLTTLALTAPKYPSRNSRNSQK